MLRLLSILSSLLLIFFFLVYKKRNKEKKLWVIFFYVLISLLTDITFTVLRDAERYKVEFFYIFSIFTIVEFSLFSAYFYLTYQSKSFKWMLGACYLAFLIISLYSLIHNNNYNFDSLAASSESIFVIIFSILFFYEQLNDPEVTFVYASKNFWVIVAFLIYAAATLFLFVFAAYLPSTIRDRIWAINSVANVVKNVLFAIAFSLPAQTGVVNGNRKKADISRWN